MKNLFPHRMSRVFGTAATEDINVDDITCNNITCRDRATFDGEVDLCGAELAGENLIDATLEGDTTLAIGHHFNGNLECNDAIVGQGDATIVGNLTAGSIDVGGNVNMAGGTTTLNITGSSSPFNPRIELTRISPVYGADIYNDWRIENNTGNIIFSTADSTGRYTGTPFSIITPDANVPGQEAGIINSFGKLVCGKDLSVAGDVILEPGSVLKTQDTSPTDPYGYIQSKVEGAIDLYMGEANLNSTDDTYGYALNGNVGPLGDFGLNVIAKNGGAGTDTFERIASFYSTVNNEGVIPGGGFDVSGTTRTRDLIATGNVNITGDLQTSANASFSGDVDTGRLLVTGDQLVEGNLTVSGDINANITLSGNTLTNINLAGDTIVPSGSTFTLGDLSGSTLLDYRKEGADSSTGSRTVNIDFGATGEINDTGTIHLSATELLGLGGYLTANIRIAATVSKPFNRTIFLQTGTDSTIDFTVSTFTDSTFTASSSNIFDTEVTPLISTATATLSANRYRILEMRVAPQVGGFSATKTIVSVKTIS